MVRAHGVSGPRDALRDGAGGGWLEPHPAGRKSKYGPDIGTEPLVLTLAHEIAHFILQHRGFRYSRTTTSAPAYCMRPQARVRASTSS